MNIDVSQIVADKLAQLEADGTIKHKIEESLERSIMSAITSELESWSFKNGIGEQLKECVASLAKDCGLGAYNGYIAEKCKAIVQSYFSADISERVQAAIDDVMFKKHDNIKLSDIFKRYREWVLEHTEDSEKYERGQFHMNLEEKIEGSWTRYSCTFADHSLDNGSIWGTKEKAEIEINFSTYGKEAKLEPITSLYINGHYMRDSFKVGHLTAFEAFVVNLYYNGTKIIMDVDDVDDDDNCFDIDI